MCKNTLFWEQRVTCAGVWVLDVYHLTGSPLLSAAAANL